jgi:methionyl-tRNA formyltransferase
MLSGWANKMKIVFMGTPEPAAKSLQRLIADGHDIAAVYTQPDRPAGRGKRVAMSPVKELALSHGLSICQPLKIKTPEALERFRSHNADVAIVVAYGRILPDTFLTAFRYGALNVHFSLLPKYRGAAPVNWAIVNGESETGVTVMQMDAGLDTGDILCQRSTEIGASESSIELMQRLGDLGAELISEALSHIDTLKPVKQNNADASLAPIMKKEDGLIDWNRTAKEIARRIRGFQPFPSSYTFNNGSRLTLWHAEPIDTASTATPGDIIEASGDQLIVACGRPTALRIIEIQPEGKRRMPIRDFLNGTNLKVSDTLG